MWPPVTSGSAARNPHVVRQRRYGRRMASNLSCVGLGVSDVSGLRSLIDRIIPSAVELGRVGDLKVLRWEDPSGARLVLGVTPDDVPDFLPSFAGVPRTQLQGVKMVNDEVAIAAVVDDDGEQLTSLAVELEQRRLLPADEAGNYRAALVALGGDVSVLTSPEEFGESDASLLSTRDVGTEPPAQYVEHGWKWPPRVAANSFFSFGVFGDPACHRARPSVGHRRQRRAPYGS